MIIVKISRNLGYQIIAIFLIVFDMILLSFEYMRVSLKKKIQKSPFSFEHVEK